MYRRGSNIISSFRFANAFHVNLIFKRTRKSLYRLDIDEKKKPRTRVYCARVCVFFYGIFYFIKRQRVHRFLSSPLLLLAITTSNEILLHAHGTIFLFFFFLRITCTLYGNGGNKACDAEIDYTGT